MYKRQVLELLKYPAYADMVSAKIRERAFEGSKSSAEQAFDRLKGIQCFFREKNCLRSKRNM